MIVLKDYQENAVAELTDQINKRLTYPESSTCVLQAPTGSGKTLMTSELLRRLVLNRKDGKKLAFIWIAVRMLHEQSKEKLDKYYENDRLIRCSYFNDLSDKRIDANEILFFNWPSINKKELNIFVRENELDNNLNNIIENTKANNCEIVVIIDESHHTAGSEKSHELLNIIKPKITLEVSATPKLSNSDYKKRVHLIDVKKEEMIKSEIDLNPGFKDLTIDGNSIDAIVIEQALKKREELLALYKKGGSLVNPLVVIQLPDQKTGEEDRKDQILSILRDKHQITEKNGLVSVWLSEEKTDTLAGIEKNDSEVQVLVCKQAPSLGWDCPRASILVMLREPKSLEFTIQTIGRIMRMPELKYYSERELNKGFIFTNQGDFSIAEDYVKDYITIYESKRREDLYQSLKLPSIFLKRQRERTRLSSKFLSSFMQASLEFGLKNKINPTYTKFSNALLTDGRLEDIDVLGRVAGSTITLIATTKATQDAFDDFIFQQCSPYASLDSSDVLKRALYGFLFQELGIVKYSNAAQQVVLSSENKQFFIDTINLAKNIYFRDVVEVLAKTRELQEVPDWEVPQTIAYTGDYLKTERTQSIMHPYYTTSDSASEETFIMELESAKGVRWWFKNGVSEIKYFAIAYDDEYSIKHAFYVDFIVQFINGSIGLFDTKAGMTAKDAKYRAEGLAAYIKGQNAKGGTLIGGIVVLNNGSWWLNQNDKYEYREGDFRNWTPLDLQTQGLTSILRGSQLPNDALRFEPSTIIGAVAGGGYIIEKVAVGGKRLLHKGLLHSSQEGDENKESNGAENPEND